MVNNLFMVHQHALQNLQSRTNKSHNQKQVAYLVTYIG